jgi:uncharacterized membrane protein YhfC
MTRARKPIVALSTACLLWCIAAGLLLWFIPLGSSESQSVSAKVINGQTIVSSGPVVAGPGQSFASVSALGPLPLIIPVVLAGIAAWSALRRHKWVLIGATILLALFAFLTGFSIGLFYLPAAAVQVVACIMALSASATASEAAR